MKSVDLVVAHDGIVATFNTEVLFKHFLIPTLCNKSNIADREGQWILQSQTITGVRVAPSYFLQWLL